MKRRFFLLFFLFSVGLFCWVCRQDRRGADTRGCGGRAAGAALHPWRAHEQGLGLLVEPLGGVGGGQRRRGQHPPGLADGREHLPRRRRAARRGARLYPYKGPLMPAFLLLKLCFSCHTVASRH